MKRFEYILSVICLILITCLSCSKDENISTNRPTEGTYIVGINLGVESPLTKGVNTGYFDNAYEENCIYLHKVQKEGDETEEYIQIPVYEYDCQNPTNPRTCTGFRYEVKYNNNGTITLTPIDSQGKPTSTNMTVKEGDEFYFSSIEGRYWSVDDDNIKPFEAPGEMTTETNELYVRDNTKNKEIYRSEQENFTLEQILDLNGDLTMVRKCSGYSFMALFSDRTWDPDYGYYLTSTEFANIMGDAYTNWYIKIYIGNMFTAQYDMQEQSGSQTAGGFYGSTDATKYTKENLDDGYFLPIRTGIIQSSTIDEDTQYTGLGYQSSNNSTAQNLLFSPTNENYNEDLTILILIKHWTQESDPSGEEGNPSTEWLSSNEGSMYTQVTYQGSVQITVQDGVFYQCGINIDIQELKAAAIANGLISSGNGNATSRSASSNAPKKFTLHNAETFIRY